MKKVTGKQIFMGALVVAIAIVLLVYLMVFTKYKDETEALKKSNKTLQEQVDELYVYYENRAQYETDTEYMVKGINDLTLDYSSQANEEDFFITAVQMQNAAIINFDKVNIDSEEVLHTVPEETVKGAEIDGLEVPIEFVGRKATYSNLTDYSNLKNCVKVIYDNKQRVGINNISYKREKETNNFIKGTIDVSFYTIQGMNKEYKYPQMDNYLSGVKNQDLFNKLVLAEDEERESSED